ncbi:hypothetical protein [Streptomyces flaveus]|uniref:hypothetical protein n=1 Tax=Streptomyces flaveus TaxID=66370 RepID=UPI00331E8067
MSGTSGDGGVRWNDETQRWEAAGDTGDAGTVGPSTAPPPPIPAHVPTDPVGPTGAQDPYDITSPVTPPPLPTPRSRRTTAVIAAATVVAVAVGVAGGVLALRDDGGGASAVSASDTSDTTPPDSGPADDALPSDPSNPWSTDAPSPTDVPSGYVLQEDTAGFTIAVLEGWTREKKKAGIFYNSPDGRSLIQIFTITEPDTPYEALRQASRDLARSNKNYAQVSLKDVPQDSGEPAAELVYAYDRPDGTRRQVVDRAFMTETGTQYAVLAAGPEENWPQQRQTLGVALAHSAS